MHFWQFSTGTQAPSPTRAVPRREANAERFRLTLVFLPQKGRPGTGVAGFGERWRCKTELMRVHHDFANFL